MNKNDLHSQNRKKLQSGGVYDMDFIGWAPPERFGVEGNHLRQ